MLDEAVINDLPIPQVWEWIALRELTSIVHGLVSEGFDSPGDLIDRLDSVSEAIAQFEQMGRMAGFGSTPYDDPVVLFDPSTGPIRDSELRRICEEAAKSRQTIKWNGAFGTVQPPDVPPDAA
jgi:hypothetical protein